MIKANGQLWGMIMTPEPVRAVHDDDLRSLLSSLGYLEKVSNGECKCAFCGKTITEDNLGSIFPHRDEILFSCDDQECITKACRLGGLK